MITKKHSIMVVDDNEKFLNSLSERLGKWGYKVIATENGIEALAKLKQQPCDLVITDLKMPKIDGINFIKEIKRANIETEFIILTAYGEVDSYLAAIKLGVFEYINKPFKPDELMRAISNALKKNG